MLFVWNTPFQWLDEDIYEKDTLLGVIQDNNMYKKIVFVDLENLSKILDEMKEADTKIVALVGFHQTNKPFTFAKGLLDHVSSVELLKVKGQGNNALDFFIAYYLGVYTNRNRDLHYIICSNDKGYDPLIKHLVDNGIQIKRLELQTEKKSIENNSTKSTKTQFMEIETTDEYNKAYYNICLMPPQKRPRKLESLKKHLVTLFHNSISIDKINNIINGFTKSSFIEVEGDKIKYKCQK